MLNWIKTHKLSFGVIVVVIGLSIYYFTHQTKPEYNVYQVETGNIRDTLDLSGRVTAEGMATLRFPAGGLITYLGAKEGDTVKKWQIFRGLSEQQVFSF